MLRWAAAGGGAHPMYHHATAAPSCLAVPLLPGASYAVVAPLSVRTVFSAAVNLIKDLSWNSGPEVLWSFAFKKI